MRLRKGYRIFLKNGRAGIITDFHWKNGERTLSYETDEGTPYWCYKSQIVEVESR